MDHLNDALFLLLNAPADASPAVVGLAIALAEYAVPLVVVNVVALWVWGEPRNRGVLIAATLAMLVGEGVNQVIGVFWFHPRPFMIGLGHTLMQHAPDSSFPSDHATFLWSLGFGLIATQRLRLWGVWITGLGVGVAWARIYVGVHFPLDMAGSAVVSAGAAGLARAALPAVEVWVLPPCDRLYEGLLRGLHLPPSAFPRRLPPG